MIDFTDLALVSDPILFNRQKVNIMHIAPKKMPQPPCKFTNSTKATKEKIGET